MPGFPFHFDIILFAMIAVFLVLRLRSVLGRRTGNERRRDPFMQRFGQRFGAAPGKVITVEPTTTTIVSPAVPDGVDALAEGLGEIGRADPAFNPQEFLDGSRAAFEIVVSAFAKGDKAALKPLLSEPVFASFGQAIDERAAAKEILENRIVGVDGAEIVAAHLKGTMAEVTVKLVSRQINLTRAADGTILEGDPKEPVEKIDTWTFSRDTRSQDPNWVLLATASA
jgi:predicted lipid-binding transport protein (Tim44 family)